jgi:hypothetical protein
MRRHLELDFEQVKWVHAEHGDCACADSGECMEHIKNAAGQ